MAAVLTNRASFDDRVSFGVGVDSVALNQAAFGADIDPGNVADPSFVRALVTILVEVRCSEPIGTGIAQVE